ncbi:MAG: hypothetical protein AABY13_00465, partial [Nanoarchaeota archaeon]
MRPIVYPAGPEVFNIKRDDAAFVEQWAHNNKFLALHPGRTPVLTDPTMIFQRCIEDVIAADVAMFDLQPFRG